MLRSFAFIVAGYGVFAFNKVKVGRTTPNAIDIFAMNAYIPRTAYDLQVIIYRKDNHWSIDEWFFKVEKVEME